MSHASVVLHSNWGNPSRWRGAVRIKFFVVVLILLKVSNHSWDTRTLLRYNLFGDEDVVGIGLTAVIGGDGFD